MLFSYEKLVHIGLDPEGAAESGLKVSYLNLALGLTTALVIVSSMSAIGIILVIALLSTPALLGLQQAPSLWVGMARSSIFGLILSVLGFFLALAFNLAPGPLVAVLCILLIGLLPSKRNN